jgi:hypothetical protein
VPVLVEVKVGVITGVFVIVRVKVPVGVLVYVLVMTVVNVGVPPTTGVLVGVQFCEQLNTMSSICRL